MQLILAIDSDRRQAEQLASLVRARLAVDLVQATSAGEGLHALKDRVPDLILTSPLLSPFDDGVLDEYLRDLGDAATHVQTLRIPVLSAAPKKKSSAKSLFSLGRKKRTAASAPDGCDPTLFADEIALYLTRAAEERQAAATRLASAQVEPDITEPVPATIEAPVEEPTYFSSSFDAVADVEATPEPLVVEEPVHIVEEVVESVPALITEPVYALEAREELPIELAEEADPIVEAISIVEAIPIVEAIEAAPIAFEQAPVLEAVCAPEPVVAQAAVADPAPKAKGASKSFEAALAAIRAAWTKPNAHAADVVPDQTAQRTVPATESAEPVHAISTAPVTRPVTPVEVDLTGEIDALEGAITGEEHPPTVVEGEPEPDAPKTPASRRRTDKAKKRPEKARSRKMRGPEGQPVQDEWGIFDPNQCGFAALVDKLDEVTDGDEAPAPARTTVRVISFG